MLRDFILRKGQNYASKWLVLAIDLVIVAITFLLAYGVQSGLTFSFNFVEFLLQLPLVLGFAFFSFIIVGSYKGVVRHTGLRDAYNLFEAVSILIMFCSGFIIINRTFGLSDRLNIPVSIIFIHYLLNIIALTISRLTFKVSYKYIMFQLESSSRVLIYGAGDSGLITYGALINDTTREVSVVGFVDDNNKKVGKRINGVTVFSKESITKDFIQKNQVDEIIISIQNISGSQLKKLTDKAIDIDVQVKIVPPVKDWINGDLNASQIKQIQIEDLLERTPIRLDNPEIAKEVNGKVVMITGAAGSIGSEISRQIAAYKCKTLVMVDQAESPMYDLQQELLRKGIEHFVPVIADVRNYHRIETIFKKYRPDMVFHAAAYKHVPLMESNPAEAVKINILGTRYVADLSSKYNVNKFVFVSTDKAVNPTNVMGATKRVAEMYIKCLQKDSKTKYITTRFGNVLGSNGSVIPLFKKQIDKGGPLTVTHPEVTRYFMTIPEASQLVIEAGTMGEGGEIFIFDMGEPVKIFDLAKKMIHLSGLKYPDDINIEITGLRPGEKLYEELLANDENTRPTHHRKIMIGMFGEQNCIRLKQMINELCLMNLLEEDSKIVKALKQIVPEYISKNSDFEKLDDETVSSEKAIIS
ncbi:polysaccharide biosynthesis protein [Spongiivirga citrea]|uniref:SDR family NAD(P)-dependent oxidoreductase n=1 Tax=Spongiivirga citrea TaxID=1481457 RepID=A0A6M0CM10_9FLAO|nr:nucleoside-diphosphate sugar epimerase/dehydratase [Spongiivirga citrea]NER16869.1 SDR family NAD(P)-dependent oxidoreductase [Spongiivirga citrea]